jgi:hypothetical protein
VGCPVGTPFSRNFLTIAVSGFLDPGLVRLGTIDTGLEVIAAGNDFELTIEPLD